MAAPVERTGRFCTLMPKLFLGSSLSRFGRGCVGGAGTAVDWTDRAGDSSLELLLESLLPGWGAGRGGMRHA